MEKIIYYPGTWDILHIGHINAIEWIKKYSMCNDCDFIYFGIESEELCITNKRKPIFNNQERRIMLMYQTKSPPIIYNNYKYETHCDFDIFACDVDFGMKEHQQPFVKYCLENKIEIVRVPRTPIISTTEIIKRIKEEIDTCSFYKEGKHCHFATCGVGGQTMDAKYCSSTPCKKKK